MLAVGVMLFSLFGSASADQIDPYSQKDDPITWRPYKAVDNDHHIIGKPPQYGDTVLRRVGLNDIKFFGSGESMSLFGKSLEPVGKAVADANSYHLYIPREEAIIPCNEKYEFCHVGVVSNEFPYCKPQTDSTGQRLCAPMNSGVSLVRKVFSQEYDGDESLIAELEYDTPINIDDPEHPILLDDLPLRYPARNPRLQHDSAFMRKAKRIFSGPATAMPPRLTEVDLTITDGTQKVPVPLSTIERHELSILERLRLKRKAENFDKSGVKPSESEFREQIADAVDELREKVDYAIKVVSAEIESTVEKLTDNGSSYVTPSIIGISLGLIATVFLNNHLWN